MPDAFEVGLGGLAQGVGLGLQLKQRDRYLRIAEEENARSRQLWNRQIEEASQVARAESQAVNAQQKRQIGENAVDRIYGRLNSPALAQMGIERPMAEVAMYAMEAMPMKMAGEYVDRVTRTAETIQSPEARAHYLDSSLYQFEGEAYQREAAELQQHTQKLIDNGALMPMAPMQAEGAEAKPAQGAEGAPAGPDGPGTIKALMDTLQLGASQAQTRSDYQALRGGLRTVREQIDQSVRGLAARKADQAATQGISQRFMAEGTALFATDPKAAMRKMSAAAMYPTITDPKARNEFLIHSLDLDNEDTEMTPEGRQAAMRATQQPQGGGGGPPPPDGEDKPDINAQITEAKRRGLSIGTKADSIQKSISREERVGGDTGALQKELGKTQAELEDITEGPAKGAGEIAAVMPEYKGQPVDRGVASWVTAYQAAGKAKGARAKLIAWAEKYGDHATKQAAKKAQTVAPGSVINVKTGTKLRERPWWSLAFESAEEYDAAYAAEGGAK